MGKKTLSIGVKQSFTDEYRCVDPFTMLAYFKNADYVVTDTFHGTVFSIKYQIPFAVLIRESNREKLSDLLVKFNLENRIVNKSRNIEKVLESEIDNKIIKKYIHLFRRESILYLQHFFN